MPKHWSKIHKQRKRWREHLIRFQMNLCFYCQCEMTPSKQDQLNTCATLDHVIPLANNGREHIDNMVVCCKKCNNLKLDYDICESVLEYQKFTLQKAKYKKKMILNKNTK